MKEHLKNYVHTFSARCKPKYWQDVRSGVSPGKDPCGAFWNFRIFPGFPGMLMFKNGVFLPLVYAKDENGVWRFQERMEEVDEDEDELEEARLNGFNWAFLGLGIPNMKLQWTFFGIPFLENSSCPST